MTQISQLIVIIGSDMNGHIGANVDSYQCHERHGHATRNGDRERLLQIPLQLVRACQADVKPNNIKVAKEKHKSTIYLLVRRRNAKTVLNTKVIPYTMTAT